MFSRTMRTRDDSAPSTTSRHQAIGNRRTSPIGCDRLKHVVKQLNLTTDELMETASRVKPLLYEARRHRIPPGLDDKVITAWNGMMLSAMAEAARVFGNAGYLESAQQTADFSYEPCQTGRPITAYLTRRSRPSRRLS